MKNTKIFYEKTTLCCESADSSRSPLEANNELFMEDSKGMEIRYLKQLVIQNDSIINDMQKLIDSLENQFNLT